MFNAQSEDGHEKYTDGKTTIDTIGPEINLLSPTNNATVYKTHIDIKGEYVELHLSKIQLINMTTQYIGTAVIDTDKTQFIITNIIIADKTNKIIVKAYDTAGNISVSTLKLYGLKSLTTVVSTTQETDIHFGDIDIFIPEGYSPCDIELIVEINEEDKLPENLGQIGDIYRIYPTGQTDNFCFLSNILVTINYDESKLGALGEDNLNMYIKHFPSTNWEIIENVVVDTQNNTITAMVPCLSAMAAGAETSYSPDNYDFNLNFQFISITLYENFAKYLGTTGTIHGEFETQYSYDDSLYVCQIDDMSINDFTICYSGAFAADGTYLVNTLDEVTGTIHVSIDQTYDFRLNDGSIETGLAFASDSGSISWTGWNFFPYLIGISPSSIQLGQRVSLSFNIKDDDVPIYQTMNIDSVYASEGSISFENGTYYYRAPTTMPGYPGDVITVYFNDGFFWGVGSQDITFTR